jgi:hypothetical protein
MKEVTLDFHGHQLLNDEQPRLFTLRLDTTFSDQGRGEDLPTLDLRNIDRRNICLSINQCDNKNTCMPHPH